jgi:site-specific DNA recombinase
MKVALYCRVSSDSQDVSLSISAQLKALREYAQRNGHIIVQEYVEEAESGRSISKRPAFREMLSAAKGSAKPFDAILVYKYSRFARNRADSIAFKTILRKLGIQVISITEPADNSPTGRLMEAIIEDLDEFYSDNLGEEVTRGMRESVSRGFYLSTKPPYGYHKVRVMDGVKQRTRLEINPAQAQTVISIFDDVLAGKGIIDIVRGLNDKGLASPKGKGWNKTGLYAILKNEIYTGTFVWGRHSKRGNPPVRAENAFPVIIKKDVFARTQNLVSSRAPRVIHPRRTASRFLLSGLVVCGQCGKALIGQDAKSGKFSYYVCGSLIKKGAGSCTTPYLNSSKFENLVVKKIKEHILTVENLSKLVDLVNEEIDVLSNGYADELETILRELGGLDQRLDNLYNIIESGKIEMDLIKPRLLELKQQRDRLVARKAELETLLSQRKIELADRDLVGRYVEDLRNFLGSSELPSRKAFIKGFVKEIKVTGNEGHIYYNFPIPPDGCEEEKFGVPSIVRYGGRSWSRTTY